MCLKEKKMFNKSYIKKCNALCMKSLIQDDLVELCKNLPKYKKKTYLELLSHFRIGLGRTYCNSYLNSQTMNDLWLMFYIHEKDGRTWVEGKNKWLD